MRSAGKTVVGAERRLPFLDKPARRQTIAWLTIALAAAGLALGNNAEAADSLKKPKTELKQKSPFPVSKSEKKSIITERQKKLRDLGVNFVMKSSGVRISADQPKDDNKIKVPDVDAGQRRMPRHKDFLNAVEARNSILERYDRDQYSLSPKPPMNKEDNDLYKFCVYGKSRYVASYGMGGINTGRVDEDTVGIDIFSMDDCTQFRESNVVVGLETRKDGEDEFVPADIAPGIIKWFASSPEYGAEYFGAFNMEEYSCEDNPDLQVRFTVENITRSNFLPVSARVRPERPLPIIDCQ